MHTAHLFVADCFCLSSVLLPVGWKAYCLCEPMLLVLMRDCSACYGKEGSPFFCAPCTHGRISAYECCLLLRCSDTEEPSMLSTGVLRRACAHVCALMHSYVCFIQNVLFNIFSWRWQERLGLVAEIYGIIWICVLNTGKNMV